MKQIEKVLYDGFTYIDGGVCAAKGFRANGVYCGIKENPTKKPDLCLVASDKLCRAAGVFTSNKVKAAPVLVSKAHLEQTGGKAWGMVLSSKNANCCNADGIDKANRVCELAAEQMGVQPEELLIAQTGVIGQILPIEPFEQGMGKVYDGLSAENHEQATIAIMTTDTVPKEVAVEFQLGGKTCHVGAMGKGSGMICPNMATTLNVVTTDCAISAELLQTALSDVVQYTYNCLYIDGDQSTNDTCVVLANGLAENAEITEQNDDYAVFRQALYIAMSNITKMLAKDGEGATKLLECTVTGAKDRENALAVAKSVIASDLLKCAMFGADANWGRVLCAVGYAPAEFDIDQVAVTLASRAGSVDVCKNGAGIDFSEDIAKTVLLEDEIEILVSVGDGPAEATAWGCDLTYDYVKINGDYRS